MQPSAPPPPMAPPAPAKPPSQSEAEALGAELQKVLDLTVRGLEVWFVLGSGDGKNTAGDLFVAVDSPQTLAAAGITSLKKAQRVRLFPPLASN